MLLEDLLNLLNSVSVGGSRGWQEWRVAVVGFVQNLYLGLVNSKKMCIANMAIEMEVMVKEGGVA